MHAESGEYPVRPGDILLVPAGEKHMTVNTGNEPLVLLCFFPVADCTRRHHRICEFLRRCRAARPEYRENMKMTDVLCLRPQADFARVDALPPTSLSVSYHAPDDAEVPKLMRKAQAW